MDFLRSATLALSLMIGLCAAAQARDCAATRPPGTPTLSPPPQTEAEAMRAPFLRFSSLDKQLLIWGGVCDGDQQRVEALFKTIKMPNEIVLISPGGSLQTGMQIGSLIHERNLTTRVRADTICASSCNFMFLGGVVRIVEPGGKFIVHMFASSGMTEEDDEFVDTVSHIDDVLKRMKAEDPNFSMTREEAIAELLDKRKRSIQEEAAVVASYIGRYLLEMQLSLRFLTTFATIPNAHARPLTRAELKSFNITNTD